MLFLAVVKDFVHNAWSKIWSIMGIVYFYRLLSFVVITNRPQSMLVYVGSDLNVPSPNSPLDCFKILAIFKRHDLCNKLFFRQRKKAKQKVERLQWSKIR